MTAKEKIEFVKNHPAKAYAYCYSGVVSFHGVVYGIEDYAVLSIGKRIAAPKIEYSRNGGSFRAFGHFFKSSDFVEM